MKPFFKNSEVTYESARHWAGTQPYPDWSDTQAKEPIDWILDYAKEDLKDSNESYRDLAKRTDYLLTFTGLFSVAIVQQLPSAVHLLPKSLLVASLLAAVCSLIMSLLARGAVSRPGLPDGRALEESLYSTDDRNGRFWIARQYYLAHVSWRLELDWVGFYLSMATIFIASAFTFAIIGCVAKC